MATTTQGTGLKKETAAALATLLGPTIIVPVLFILLEKDEFVRFWAFQSLVVFLVLETLPWLVGLTIIFAFLLVMIVPLCTITGVILWLTMTYKAWQGEKWEIPYVGKFVGQLMKRA